MQSEEDYNEEAAPTSPHPDTDSEDKSSEKHDSRFRVLKRGWRACSWHVKAIRWHKTHDLAKQVDSQDRDGEEGEEEEEEHLPIASQQVTPP